MLQIPFLRTGTFVARNGRSHRFGEAELAQVERYDPSLWRAPLLIGHDLPSGTDEVEALQSKSLAFGIIDRVVRRGRELVAQVSRYSPQLKTLHERGQLPSASVKLFSPDDPANPYGRVLGIRHLAFVPEPGVSGLGEPQFGEFSLDGSELDIDFSYGGTVEPTPEELLQKEREQFEREKLEFAARIQSIDFVRPLVDAGKLPPAQQEGVVALRTRLAAQEDAPALEFSAAGEAQSLSPVAVLDSLLKSLPVQIEFAKDVSGDDGGADPKSSRPEHLAQAALEFQRAEKAAGREISLVDAYNRVNPPKGAK